MKKTGRLLLMAALAVTSLACAAGGVAAGIDVNADSTLTVGEFTSWDGYVFNGTADGKTTISYNWTSGGTYLARVNVSGFTYSSSDTVELSFTSDADATVRLVLFEAGGWTVYGSDAISYETMTANTGYIKSIALSTYESDLNALTTFDLGFYFDSGTATSATKTVMVNSLTVAGVSYTPTKYVAGETVETPEKSFKEYTDWTASNGTVTANELKNMEETDENYSSAVSDGAGNFVIADVTQAASLEIPLYQTLTAWPTNGWDALYIKIKSENISSVYAYFESPSSDDYLFCADILGGAWNASAEKSVSDGYYLVTVSSISGYFSTPLSTFGSVTKIVLVPFVKEGASSASLSIGGMTFSSSTPVFINDVGTPELDIGTWVSGGNSAEYLIAENGTYTVSDGTEYTGIRVDYSADDVTSYGYIYSAISNFDAEKYPSLRIGFYASADVTLEIYAGWGVMLLNWTDFSEGYHVLTLDASAISDASFNLMIFLDSREAVSFDGTKTMIFDQIIFYAPYDIVLSDASTNGLYSMDLTSASSGSISWSWDGADAGLYYYVSVPVDSWYSFDRYLVVNVTFSADCVFGVWFNSLGILEHASFSAGTYTFYLDTAEGYAGGYYEENGVNALYFYCDVNNPSSSSVIKTVTINSLSFTDEESLASSPAASVVTIDYSEETLSFDSAYEVSASEDFETLIESGSSVTPGATYYVRLADAGSAATSFTVAERPAITADSAPVPTVGSNFIRFATTGYSYKLGEDGEWSVNLGSWGNLIAGTEYVVYVKVTGTDTSFESEVYTMTVTTLAEGGDSAVASVTVTASATETTVGSNVTFTAAVSPSDAEAGVIVWYVNGSEVTGSSSTYTLDASEEGTYTVYCTVDGVQSNTVMITISAESASGGNVGVVIGVIGGIALVIVLAAVVLIFVRRRQNKND